MSMATTTIIPELLIEIFIHLASIWPAPDMSTHYRHPSYRHGGWQSEELIPVNDGSPVLGWVNITFVCGRWRRIAIGSPILWSDINVGLGPEWMDAFVQRSGSIPVALGNRDRSYVIPIHYETHPIAGFKEVLRVLPEIWHRVRYFHLSCGGDADEDELPLAIHNYLSRPNPFIERCELMGYNEVHDVVPLHGLFAGDAPLLRHFFCNLRSVKFSWHAAYISHLRSLVICCRVGLPPLAELVDSIIRRLRHVEWLDLAFLLNETDENLPDALHHVELPYLSRLGLEGSSSSVAYVFKNLRVADSASVELRCQDTSTEALSRLFPVINNRYDEWFPSSSVTLYVNYGPIRLGRRNPSTLYVSVWPTELISNKSTIELDPDYDYNSRLSSILLILKGGQHQPMLDKLVNDITPFSRATCLHVPQDSLTHYPDLFRLTPNIDTLYISRWKFDFEDVCHRKLAAVLKSLLCSARAIIEGQASMDHLLLPRLQLLHVALDLPGTWHRSDSDSPEDGPLTEQLGELVTLRTAIGAPLRGIRIVDESLMAEETGVRLPLPDQVRTLLCKINSQNLHSSHPSASEFYPLRACWTGTSS